jgi:queuosine precursor transporter
MDQRRVEGFIYLLGFGASIPLSNWMIGHVGVVCPAEGPCLLPVGPGILAPSGVLVVGLAFVLRDLVQRRLGRNWTLLAIAVGALLSALLAPPPLVVASGGAFAVSELADFAVYTPLQRRGLVLAVLVSSLVGLVVDSILFLQLAFGGLEFLMGQVLGKVWMVLLSLPLIAWLRRRDERLGIQPA